MRKEHPLFFSGHNVAKSTVSRKERQKATVFVTKENVGSGDAQKAGGGKAGTPFFFYFSAGLAGKIPMVISGWHTFRYGFIYTYI